MVLVWNQTFSKLDNEVHTEFFYSKILSKDASNESSGRWESLQSRRALHGQPGQRGNDHASVVLRKIFF